MAQKVFNRNFVVIGAILIQLALGAIYAWSVFTPELQKPLAEDGFDDVVTTTINGTEYTFEFDGAVFDEAKENDNSSVTITATDSQGRAYNGTFTLEFRLFDQDGKEIEEYKVKGDTVYDADEVVTHTFESGDTIEGLDLATAGNWHFIVERNGQQVANKQYQFQTGEFGFTKTQTQVVFSVGLATFAVVMIIAGRLQPKLGPMKLALFGGVLLGAGYILAGLLGNTFITQVIFIGGVAGAGIGLAYVVPIAVGMKWFPDKKGMISGIGVAGFGFGATIWVKLAGEFGQLIQNYSVLGTFMIYGFIFLVFVVIGAFTMVNPPEGWKPPSMQKEEDEKKDQAGDDKPAKKEPGTGAIEYKWQEMIKTPQFWMVWATFVFGGLAGLMVIGNIKLFGISALTDSGFSTADASNLAGTAMAIYAITNGLGRIVWGTLSDKLGRKRSIMTMSAIQGVFMLILLTAGSNPITFTILAAGIGFNFGGNFALFPSITADYFGTKTVGANYGYVFTSYGVGGVIGPILGGIAAESAAGYSMAFVPAGIMCLVGAGLFLVIRPPKAKLE